MVGFWIFQFFIFSDNTVKACSRLIDLSLQRKITHLAYLDLIRLYASNADSVEVDEVGLS